MNKNLLQRFYQYDFKVGFLPSGRKNSIADVPGVKVGHFTKIAGRDIRTGMTIIDPGVKNLFRNKIPAAICVGNGYGKLAGYTQVEELGTLETPITLTNTHSVGPVMRGIVDLVIKQTPDIGPLESINAVVGEINDGRLNNIHSNNITCQDVEQAYANKSENFTLGNVGGGTGARAFSWKGGIGTASRVISLGIGKNKKSYILGVLVQTNYGGSLNMLGVPIGEILGKNDFSDFVPQKPDGSCNIIVATDAPLTARQLKRITARTFVGLARTGSIIAHASGDYTIAFSTNRTGLDGPNQRKSDAKISISIDICLADNQLNPFFLAAAEATEEAVYDALFAAQTMTGINGNTLEALPKNKVISLLKKYAHQSK